MSTELYLQILSPDHIAFEGVVKSVHIPCALGEIEVFVQHSDFVSSLLPGYITVRLNDGKEDIYFTNDGYVEVHNNKASLILDDIIDVSLVDETYLTDKITMLKAQHAQFISQDDQYNKITNSLARYQQFLEA